MAEARSSASLSSAPLLRVDAINAGYGTGSADVLRELSLQVSENEIVTIIGANGAGKTTLMRALSGTLALRAGSIAYRGKDMAGKQAWQFARAGVRLVKEGRGIFGTQTVEENLLIGGWLRDPRELANELPAIYRRFPMLGERRNQLGGSLSGGQQQILAVARALIAKPKLLMLDEPSLGLAPLIVQEVFRLVGELRGTGIGILLVEQNARKALQVADRAYVMQNGRITRQGIASDLATDPEIVNAYLGIHQPSSKGGSDAH